MGIYMAKEKLIMVQGFDRHHKEFTAFVLCDEQQSEAIEKAKSYAVSLNLKNLNIIYTMPGHNVDEKTQHDIQEYYQQLTGEVVEA
jgi:hypothetical protein